VITAALSCPQPPLLLPGMTGGVVAEVEHLRSACLQGLAGLLASGADRIVLIGAVRPNEGERPLSLQVGQALLAAAGATVAIEHRAIAADLAPEQCLALGRELGMKPGRAALLVMADGSARRGPKAPGYLDPRAAPFDRRVEAALGQAHPPGLADLDPGLADELLVAGRAAWQVLAGAFSDAVPRAELLYSGDPFGVWYPVCLWTAAA
jgi:hypothetical protein